MKDLFNLDEFNKRFPTEQHCLDYLYSLRWSDGYFCYYCGKRSGAWEVSPNKYKCRSCGHQTTVTADTIFHHTHIPLIKWFQAAWYLTNVNNNATAKELQKLLGIGSNRTAQSITKKLKTVMYHPDFDNSEKLKGVIEVSGASLDVDVFIYLAVELCHEKVQKVKMAAYPTGDEETFNDFISSVVEPNSSLQISAPLRKIGKLRYHTLSPDLEEKGISFKWRPLSYEYQYVENVFNDFWDYYDEYTYSSDFIDEAISAYTQSVNCYYPNISFEELLLNAVELRPLQVKKYANYKLRRKNTK